MCPKLAKEWFGGHQVIVFTYPDGDNGAGNIHAHIVFNLLRIHDEPVREWIRGRSWLPAIIFNGGAIIIVAIVVTYYVPVRLFQKFFGQEGVNKARSAGNKDSFIRLETS